MQPHRFNARKHRHGRPIKHDCPVEMGSALSAMAFPAHIP